MGRIEEETGKIIQGKINGITSDMEQSLEKLKLNHYEALERLKILYLSEIQILSNKFESKWNEFNTHHLHNIAELEEKIIYLKELTSSQRLMMEDHLRCLQELERKVIGQSAETSGKTI